MGAFGYDRFSLTVTVRGRNVEVGDDILSPSEARELALKLHEAANRAEIPKFDAAAGKGQRSPSGYIITESGNTGKRPA